MKFYELTKKLRTEGVTDSIRSYGHLIEMVNEQVLLDGELTKFKSLEEARQYVKQEYISEKLEQQVSKESYDELSDEKVASIIKEYHDVKVTDTLIETYIKLASSNMFSVDPVVQDIRSLNKLDRIVEGKLHYVLADESIVAINPQTQDHLNKLLGNQPEIIEYMRESKENFFYVLEQIEE